MFLVDLETCDSCAQATFCAELRQDEQYAFTRFAPKWFAASRTISTENQQNWARHGVSCSSWSRRNTSY